MRAIQWRPSADIIAARTSGKRVYPIMHTLCAKELSKNDVVSKFVQVTDTQRDALGHTCFRREA